MQGNNFKRCAAPALQVIRCVRCAAHLGVTDAVFAKGTTHLCEQCDNHRKALMKAVRMKLSELSVPTLRMLVGG